MVSSGWEFPGGKIEEGETPQAALKREIMEDLDTQIDVGELIDTIAYELSVMMHIIICRKEDVKAYFGIDINNDSDLRRLIDMRVDLLLSDIGKNELEIYCALRSVDMNL